MNYLQMKRDSCMYLRRHSLYLKRRRPRKTQPAALNLQLSWKSHRQPASNVHHQMENQQKSIIVQFPSFQTSYSAHQLGRGKLF